MTEQRILSSDGQVTIPRDVIDALGIKPGEAIEFSSNDRGELVIRKGMVGPYSPRKTCEEMAAAIDRVVEERRNLVSGRSTDKIMAELRGDEPLP